MAPDCRVVDRTSTVLSLLATMALGVSAGALLMEGAVLVPYWQSLDPAAFLAWYADNAARLFNFFAPVEITAGVLALLAAGRAVLRRQPGRLLLVVAAALALAILLAFPLLFEEVNEGFASGAVPLDEVGKQLRRWAAWHWLRVVTAFAAFAAALVGATRNAKTASL